MKGEFTLDISLEEYIERQVELAVTRFNMDEDKAIEMANRILPKLKRWKNL